MSIANIRVRGSVAVLIVCVGWCLLPMWLVGTTNCAPDRLTSRVRIGPLFEYRTTSDGGTFWALRPFFSRFREPVVDTGITDVIWPLATLHRDRKQMWWRALLAYGSDSDLTNEDGAWNAALFPIYFQGKTRLAEDYWALFPIYGHMPHILLMEDIHFVLFPCYLNYSVKGVERDYYLWPFFSQVKAQADERRTSYFPFYGQAQSRTSLNTYICWPFWTSAVYKEDRNLGASWMAFPFYGEVTREHERQTLVLPPFFSHAKTDASERWRMPWPLVETMKTLEVTKRSFWPWYGDVMRDDEQRWYAAWPLIEHFNLISKGGRTERSRCFPFYVNETVYKKKLDGGEQKAERYLRIWPFCEYKAVGEETRLRILGLSLIQHSGGIDRNWAPFWTLYERSQCIKETSHDALWGMFQLRIKNRDEVVK